ncbi:polygalacturonase At1g48100-like [Cryptomeria japonica]|uniref:polygalacturonase At1g48100-like n=1 Tax=Cryptomeria japonica TaxID=3369 RepID=UPI0027DA0309|nr:polygalacturonase At1g48100-like [Cryptomeria japonica]
MSSSRIIHVMFVVILVFGLRYKCLGARDFKIRSLVALSSPNSTYHYDVYSNVVDVTTLGAKGDGETDDTKAFLAAWQAACEKDSATLLIPSDYQFLVGPLTFLGPCKSNILFKIKGNVIAPVNSKAWASKPLNWINFSKLNGITIVGDGTFDGQGAAWWKNSEQEDTDGSKLPSLRPTAIRFYGSYDVTVQGITIRNSPQFHLKFDSCTSVTVVNFTTSSPANSPNTDGIHLQNSEDVEIHHSTLACGDDCMSIQTGCSGIRVHNINCGPGHGISIGSLGKDGTKACVSNVSVYDSNIHDASNVVRIKTWQGGIGQVKSVSFSNIEVSNVKVPIDVDQFYCDKKACSNQTSGVFISDVTYKKSTGTYSQTPVYLACSDEMPCTDLKLINIELEPVGANENDPFCWNSYGDQENGVECLQPGRPPNDPSHTQSPDEKC